MSETKTCKQCNQSFNIEPEDLEFYDQMSPSFDNKKFVIPTPTLCPLCRRQKRLAFRNLTKVYKRKCDKSGKDIISFYAPNSKYTVYENSIWFSDSWDATNYGQEYDPNKSFFVQMQEVSLKVPRMHSSVVNNENSDYTSNVTTAKNCYLVFGSSYIEDCMFGQGLLRVKDSLDCWRMYDSELCYESLNADKCYNCFYSNNITNCRESMFLDSCVGCSNCFGCSNLNNKQFWLYNKQSTEEEVLAAKNDFLELIGNERQQKIEEIRKFLNQTPKKFAYLTSSENCTGDYIIHGKNSFDSYYMNECEDIKYCSNSYNHTNSAYDHDFWGNNAEFILDTIETGNNCSKIYYSRRVYQDCSNIYYCLETINGSHDCFGCVGLKGKQYCILNKQYTKEEYEKKVAEIIENMTKSGEWGEFMPIKMAQFGYNEALANEYYPLSKSEAEKIGANWQKEDFGMKYDGPFYQSKNISEYNPKDNPSAEANTRELLSGILKCEVSGRPYKIQSQELLFYIKNNLQIPLRHPDQRYEDRIKMRNPMNLWHRQCNCIELNHDHQGKCPNEFETTYAPDRPEKIYCERCYQKSII